MKFLLLLTESDPGAWETVTEEERDAVFAAHSAFDAAVRGRATMHNGEALAGVETAVTLRAADDKGERALTVGPYAETVEQLGGYYLIETPDQDMAVELCRLLPSGYTIEIRPVIDIEGYEP